MSSASSVRVTTSPMSADDVIAVADGAHLVLERDVVEQMQASHDVLRAAVSQGSAVYGVTAGLGHARDRRVAAEDVAATQAAMMRAHAGGIGAAMPARVVRAAMMARVVGLSRGGSGARPQVAACFVAMLNHGIVPIVPAVASVGAADLGHMAHIGLAAMGEGTVLVHGSEVTASEALADAGISPLTLQLRDALAVLSANAVTLGAGALALHRTDAQLDRADDVFATSLDAIRGNPSILLDAVQQAKGGTGQATSAARMRARLGGSQRVAQPASLQDPLSFRVAAVVHGACRDVARQTREALETELNARTDNPVSVPPDREISNGNFHPVLVAVMFESLRIALAHVALLTDRRIGQMWDEAVDTALDEPVELAGHPVPPGLLLRYPAAARSTEARRLANPVTLDVPILDRGQEDHAMNAPAAVEATEAMLDVVADLAAVELLTAHHRLEIAPSPAPSESTRRLMDDLTDVLNALPPDAASAVAHREVVRLMAMSAGTPTSWPTD